VIARFVTTPRGHADLLLEMAAAVLARAAIEPAALDGVAVGRGPGSFTGVRIAVSAAQGLAMAADCPVVPVSTLAAMAVGAGRRFGGSRFAIALDARMEEVYWGAFAVSASGVQVQGEECVCAPSARPALPSGTWLGLGSGWARYGDALLQTDEARIRVRPEPHFPHARDILLIARPKFDAGHSVAVDSALPVYLRDRVAEKPGRGR
jgi:tRNA threonylcarbamoyladenosine biosynthesis protein TsaB